MLFIKKKLLFTILILDILLTSCHNNQNISITDLKIYLKKIQPLNISIVTCDFNSQHTIKYLNIFEESSHQDIIKQNDSFSLTGIIHINKKVFALVQNKNQSFITKPGDIIPQGKITNISSEKVCIQQKDALFNNNTCITLYQK